MQLKKSRPIQNQILRISTFSALLFSFSFSTYAEVIHLKEGGTVEGRLEHYFNGLATIKLKQGGEKILGQNEIEKIEFSVTKTPKPKTSKKTDTPKTKKEEDPNFLTTLAKSDSPYGTPLTTFQTWRKAAIAGDIGGMTKCYASFRQKEVRSQLKKLKKDQRNQMQGATARTEFTPTQPLYQGDRALLEINWTKDLAGDSQVLQFIMEKDGWKFLNKTQYQPRTSRLFSNSDSNCFCQPASYSWPMANSVKEKLSYSYIGIRAFSDVWNLQEEIRKSILNGDGQERLLLVEHPRTVSIGRGEKGANVLFQPDQLREMGFDVVEVNRGGKVTYHGPGQLVAYPIVDIRNYGGGVKSFVCGLERTMIDLLADYGLKASRKDGFPGAWLPDRKIGSVGIHVRHHVSIHGLALNINPDLKDFSVITPCGIKNISMTSMKEEGIDTNIDEMIEPFIESFSKTFSRELVKDPSDVFFSESVKNAQPI